MMGSLSLEDEKLLKELTKELNYTAIKNLRNLLRLEKDTKAIKDRILRDIKNLFEHAEEDYYKPVRVRRIFGVKIILNIKVTVISRKHYQLKNILIKLDHV